MANVVDVVTACRIGIVTGTVERLEHQIQAPVSTPRTSPSQVHAQIGRYAALALEQQDGGRQVRAPALEQRPCDPLTASVRTQVAPRRRPGHAGAPRSSHPARSVTHSRPARRSQLRESMGIGADSTQKVRTR